MATAESVAIRREAALDGLARHAARWHWLHNIKPPVIPTSYREPAELPVMQMEALVDWLEQVVKVETNGENNER
ncbi:MAG: hypothetical protein ABI700_00715 [Chloroflexota bacterium]